MKQGEGVKKSFLRELPGKLTDEYFRLKGIELVDIDYDTIRVSVGKPKRVVTLGVFFPSSEDRENFLASKRTRMDFYRAKGALQFAPSQEDKDRAEARGINTKPTHTDDPNNNYRWYTYSVMEQILGVKGLLLIEAYNFAEWKMLAYMASLKG